MRRDFLREAKAQAMAKTFREVVPDGQGVKLVGADQHVNVIAADGASVAGVALSMNHFVNRVCCHLAFVVVDPEEGEIQELFVCYVKFLELFATGLLLSGFSSQVNGSKGFEFVVEEIDRSRSTWVIDCPVTIKS